MITIGPDQLNHYATASVLEWIETDGVGGVIGSSVINANTRKQHALFTVAAEPKGRIVCVANLQETLADGRQTHDLSTNAYFGAIHPCGFQSLESFRLEPWPSWTYRFDPIRLDKQIVPVHGEHAIVVEYTLRHAKNPMTLTVRPLLAFRDFNGIRGERGSFPNNWTATREFIECRPFEDGPTIYIAHPNARIETIGLWYRGFLYERDRESRLDCIEDLYHPGSLALTIEPDEPCALIFASPSPRSVTLAREYRESEKRRRESLVQTPGLPRDPLWTALLRTVDAFIYERRDGVLSIMPGLPWGEGERYRGLMAFAGLLLAPKRFDLARQYLEGIAADWRSLHAPSRFEPEPAAGQMHPADVPLWIFIAAWRYWKATGDKTFRDDLLTPLLEDIAQYYMDGGETRCTPEGFVEVGYESGADYAPLAPLGTNALWYNAQRILAAFLAERDNAKADMWNNRAKKMRTKFNALFACTMRPGLADSITREPYTRDETLRASQILAVGLPFMLAEQPDAILECVTRDLYTPVGLRTLSPHDARYVGDGSDIRFLPKCWSGSVDPLWLGCYWDAVSHRKRVGDVAAVFSAFETDMKTRGLGHISGAFTGDPPHQPCDYIASAAPIGEIMRLYAREALQLPHVV